MTARMLSQPQIGIQETQDQNTLLPLPRPPREKLPDLGKCIGSGAELGTCLEAQLYVPRTSGRSGTVTGTGLKVKV